MKRTAFYVSDSTGITAHTLGQSLLAQFEGVQIEHVIVPYVDTAEKIRDLVTRINAAYERDGHQPLVFDTIVNDDFRGSLAQSHGFMVDILGAFLKPLEKVLNTHSSYSVGRAHSAATDSNYKNRMDAVNYAMDNDDGARITHYDRAEIILVGVSRSGKTPTCLYMALQFGVYTANYPITEDDISDLRIPKALQPFKQKLFGLTIDPERLAAIRHERRPDSKYASFKQCEFEVREVEAIFRRYGIPYLDTTHFSVEEITTRILSQLGVERRQ
jgi:[pyruvate, water dikinase]-phosphate phosphotransferase / [pyruvate, water dikinase] kinase